MFKELYSVNSDDLLEEADSEGQKMAARYAVAVLNGEYRLAEHAHAEDLDLDQKALKGFAREYSKLCQNAREGEFDQAEDYIPLMSLEVEENPEIADNLMENAMKFVRHVNTSDLRLGTDYSERTWAALSVWAAADPVSSYTEASVLRHVSDETEVSNDSMKRLKRDLERQANRSIWELGRSQVRINRPKNSQARK